MPRLLAIDPGGQTGIAYHRRDDGQVANMTWELRGVGGVRLLKLPIRLSQLHAEHGFVRVGYEQPYGGPYFPAVRVLCHYEAMIMSWAASRNLPCAGYAPRQIKEHVATGKADKATVFDCVRRLGYFPTDYHQSDAIALLLLMRSGARPIQSRRTSTAKREPDLFTKPKRRKAA